MSAENLGNHIYTRDEMNAKFIVQKEIILRLCEDPNSNESKGKWIFEYGRDFSDAFERRRAAEPNFIERCISERDQIIEELIEEVKTLHQQRLENAA